MAHPYDARALPGSGWRPNDPALGAAPADGDFARLLEAASAPAAHRMRVPPEIEGWGPTRRGRRVPYGAPGMVREHAGDDGARGLPGPATGPRHAAGVPATDAGSGGPPDLVGALSRLGSGARAWRDRPPRERIVLVFFGLVALWIVLGLAEAVWRGVSDGDPGLILVLGVVAFFLLRGWLGSRRRRPDARR